jgi:hypothetical protein
MNKKPREKILRFFLNTPKGRRNPRRSTKRLKMRPKVDHLHESYITRMMVVMMDYTKPHGPVLKSLLTDHRFKVRFLALLCDFFLVENYLLTCTDWVSMFCFLVLSCTVICGASGTLLTSGQGKPANYICVTIFDPE